MKMLGLSQKDTRFLLIVIDKRRPSSVGEGGAPATAQVTVRESLWAVGSFTLPLCTVGAPQ